jgi:hypothetical protein
MANASSAAAQEQKLNEEQTGKTGVASVYLLKPVDPEQVRRLLAEARTGSPSPDAILSSLEASGRWPRRQAVRGE